MNKQIVGMCSFELRAGKCDPARDISIRLDRAGFVVDASQNANLLGLDPQSLLVMPHIADFAQADHRAKVSRYFRRVISGRDDHAAIEFRVNNLNPLPEDGEEVAQPQWYALDLRSTGAENSSEAGAVGMLQSVQHKYETPTKGLISGTNDPFTGLPERRCFVSQLIGHIALHETVSLVVFAIDGMRAIFMQYGQGTADEIRWGFARFLETMTESHHTLGQIDDERFGVLLPGMQPKEARQWANDALHIFAKLAMPSNGSSPELCASAGVARGELSAEWTIRQAELGLVMARAAGGMQATICQPHSCLSSGHLVERAMEEVVARAVKRVP